MSAKSIFIVTTSIFGSAFLGIFLSTIIFDGPSPDSGEFFENESLEKSTIPKIETIIESPAEKEKPETQDSKSTESNLEVIPSSSTQKELKITGTVGSGVRSTYTVVVSGSATVGGLSNPPSDQVSADGKTITGFISARGTDNYFFTGDIVSIVADQKMTTTVDGVKFPNSTPNLVTES